MNLLGRLFIVLILMGSIILASFSVVLYSTHTNWRKHAVKLQRDLDAVTQELAALQKSKTELETALNLEIKSQAARNVALAERVRLLTQDNEEKRLELAELEEKLHQQVAAVKNATETTEALRARFDGISEALLESQRDWAHMSTQLNEQMDKAHGLALLLTSYQSTSAQLAKDYRDVVEVLRIHGLSADPELYSRQPPSGISGIVTEVRRGGIVEISIGSDSGLIKGHQLDVVRNRDGRSSYIGKIEITQTAADRAVAKVIPEFRRGDIRRDDEITYIDIDTVVAY